MPIIVDGQTYYRISEACKRAGISKSTCLRWLKEGVLEDVSHADRRGWRLFTERDMNRIKTEANKITTKKFKKGGNAHDVVLKTVSTLQRQPLSGD
jgi:excisionase family DNA binding protein